MIKEANEVAKVIGLNGGTLIGRTRLQKTFYFLEALNCGFGFDFAYHIYGPYCDELADTTSFAKASGLIDEKVKTADTGPYSIYSSHCTAELLDPLDQKRADILARLRKVDAITLELAATADYLSKSGFAADAWDETTKRKASKATTDKVAKAQSLLVELSQFR